MISPIAKFKFGAILLNYSCSFQVPYQARNEQDGQVICRKMDFRLQFFPCDFSMKIFDRVSMCEATYNKCQWTGNQMTQAISDLMQFESQRIEANIV